MLTHYHYFIDIVDLFVKRLVMHIFVCQRKLKHLFKTFFSFHVAWREEKCFGLAIKQQLILIDTWMRLLKLIIFDCEMSRSTSLPFYQPVCLFYFIQYHQVHVVLKRQCNTLGNFISGKQKSFDFYFCIFRMILTSSSSYQNGSK